MNKRQADFLCQALETEQGGVLVYAAAILCAKTPELKEEWQKYLDETKEHVGIYTELMQELNVDPLTESPGRTIVREKGAALVACMKQALKAGDAAGAEIVAAECVVDAETKCHMNWHLVGEMAKTLKGAHAKRLQTAYDQVEVQEDEHLYHTAGWARELWIQYLGMPAVIPPPEEAKDVKTAIGAARAKHSRASML